MSIQEESSQLKDKRKKKLGFLLSIPLFFLKLIYISFFIFICFLLLKSVFAPAEGSKQSKSDNMQEEEKIFSEILQNQETVSRDHFHIVDDYIKQPDLTSTLCASCHGVFPHHKEEKVRAMLNMHNGFMACSVCHLRNDGEHENHSFAWVDRMTHEMSSAVEGSYGKYPAKIFPIKNNNMTAESIIRPVNEKAATLYMDLKDQYTSDQAAQAQKKLHENLSEKPIFCTECHQEEGYFNYASLGFTEARTRYLTTTEVADMIIKYDTFYMPSVIDFGDQ